MFLPAARLWVVFLLKASGTCDLVLNLSLGPITEGSIGVSFRGRRHKKYSNSEPASIEVVGECQLSG